MSSLAKESKRMSLDVFKEKAVATEVGQDQKGGATSVPCIITVVTLILTTPTPAGSSPGTIDCHP